MIRLEHLNIGYKTPVQINFNLTIERGKCYALVGNNGTGKSTLLKTIAGLIKPISGNCFVEDEPYEAIKLSDVIAYLPARVNLFSDKTVLFLLSLSENIIQNKTKKSFREDVIHCFQIEELLSKTYFELSDGQKQRLLIAMQFLRGCNYVLLDEPLNHLDMDRKENLMKFIFNHASAHNVSVVVSLHDKHILDTYFEHIIELR